MKPVRRENGTFTPEEKSRIAKCAMECGVTYAIGKLSKEFPDHLLKESSIRLWMNKYKNQLKRNKAPGEHLSVNMENKKRGHPLLMRDELDQQVKLYIEVLCNNGAVVNSAMCRRSC